jgi:subtilisin family serine protease
MREYSVSLNKDIDYNQFWNEIENLSSEDGFVPSRRVEIVNNRDLSLRTCTYELSDEEAALLRNDPRVYCVEIPPDQRTDIMIMPSTTQTGLYYKSPGTNPANNMGINWGLFRLNSTTNNTPGSSGTLDYDYILDGTGVDFVIQDSGLQCDHPEFNDSLGVTRVQKINWYTASGLAGTQPADNLFYTDTDGHGTHCTGIAAGLTYGRAKNARIYSVMVEGLNGGGTQGLPVSDVFDVIKGWHLNKPIDPVTGYKRPTVVNMSWSYVNTFTNIQGGVYRGTSWTGTTKQPNYGMIGGSGERFGIRVGTVDVDVDELLSAGVILCGAAGNYYQTIDVPGGLDYDNYFTDGVSSRYYMQGGSPPSAPGVICVGNVSTGYDSPERKAGSSESGPRVDIWAPGTNIVSTTSTVNDFGATTDYPFDSNYKIMSISGTSMASPNVAGVAVQMAQKYPSYTPAQIKQEILDVGTSDALYSTGLSTDYSNAESLHGGANLFAYQPYSVSATTTLSVSGAFYITPGLSLTF